MRYLWAAIAEAAGCPGARAEGYTAKKWRS